MRTKTFDLVDVLGATTGVVIGHMDGIVEVVAFMCGTTYNEIAGLPTTLIAMAAPTKAAILAQHPELVEFTERFSDITDDALNPDLIAVELGKAIRTLDNDYITLEGP